MSPAQRSWNRFKARLDPVFDMLLERRGNSRRVYEWHVRFWAADPRHPNHAYALVFLDVQPSLFAGEP